MFDKHQVCERSHGGVGTSLNILNSRTTAWQNFCRLWPKNLLSWQTSAVFHWKTL